MSKPFKHDPQWVKAKQLCRLNQDDIAKAKALGLTPKTLMKNIPSPQQKWKAPVKQWIGELYAKKFGARIAGDSNPRGPQPVASGKRKAPARSKPPASPFGYEPDLWDNEADDFLELDEDPFPTVPLEGVAFFYTPDDPEWQNHRLGRRQMNLRWTAAALAVALRGIDAVDGIALFGSVAKSILEAPPDQLWEEPLPRTPCRDLDLALWLTRCDAEVLRAITEVVGQTLDSLAAHECIILGADQLDLHILDAETDRFLGHLRPSAADSVIPGLELTPDFILKAKALTEPHAVILFERELPPAQAPATDQDCPF